MDETVGLCQCLWLKGRGVGLPLGGGTLLRVCWMGRGEGTMSMPLEDRGGTVSMPMGW